MKKILILLCVLMLASCAANTIPDQDVPEVGPIVEDTVDAGDTPSSNVDLEENPVESTKEEPVQQETAQEETAEYVEDTELITKFESLMNDADKTAIEFDELSAQWEAYLTILDQGGSIDANQLADTYEMMLVGSEDMANHTRNIIAFTEANEEGLMKEGVDTATLLSEMKGVLESLGNFKAMVDASLEERSLELY